FVKKHKKWCMNTNKHEKSSNFVCVNEKKSSILHLLLCKKAKKRGFRVLSERVRFLCANGH
ncbi:MAG: hypothetical protein J6N71_05860, partial [Muribaculaceae bacterium]|nr:hypothetical protein [Muribaculaceae bacterium]